MSKELAEANREIERCRDEVKAKNTEIKTWKCHPEILKEMTLEQCNQLEKDLKQSLDNLSKRKEALIALELQHQSEQRLCVICVEKDKSVLLLPCRHLCLCDKCAEYDNMTACPLCRRPIAHRISVFS